MSMFRTGLGALCVLALAPSLGGCVVAAVTGAAVRTTGAVVGTTARTTGKAVRAVIPDGEDEDSGRSGGQNEYQSGYDSGSYSQGGASSGGGYTRADAEAAVRRQ